MPNLATPSIHTQPSETPVRLPSLFVPHGAPTFALRPGAAGAALQAFAKTLPKAPALRAIVVVSAHWQTQVPHVGFATQPTTVHDFYGFPEALYAIQYPAMGSPQIAEEVALALEAAGMTVVRDAQHGLDHGAWVPLRLMFPEAGTPVIPLSLPQHGGAQAAYRLGQALQGLAEKGVLVIGSGSMTHNLRDYQIAARNGGQTPAYVSTFTDWIAQRLEAKDVPALLDYRRQAPAAAQAHPTDEHLLPFFVALGAAGAAASTPSGKRFYAGVDDYVISMDAYAFIPPVGATQ